MAMLADWTLNIVKEQTGTTQNSYCSDEWESHLIIQSHESGSCRFMRSPLVWSRCKGERLAALPSNQRRLVIYTTVVLMVPDADFALRLGTGEVCLQIPPQKVTSLTTTSLEITNEVRIRLRQKTNEPRLKTRTITTTKGATRNEPKQSRTQTRRHSRSVSIPSFNRRVQIVHPRRWNASNYRKTRYKCFLVFSIH